MNRYTDADKLACVEREIVMRKHVYGPRVLNRKMSAGEAEREIGIMKAVATDYRDAIEAVKGSGG